MACIVPLVNSCLNLLCVWPRQDAILKAHPCLVLLVSVWPRQDAASRQEFSEKMTCNCDRCYLIIAWQLNGFGMCCAAGLTHACDCWRIWREHDADWCSASNNDKESVVGMTLPLQTFCEALSTVLGKFSPMPSSASGSCSTLHMLSLPAAINPKG